MPGGYVSGSAEKVLETALTARFGSAQWILPGGGETNFYLNRSAIQNPKSPDGKPVNEAEIYRVAREALLSSSQLHVARVYTRDQLDNGVTGDFIAIAEMNGYNPERSGDIAVVLEPNYLPGPQRHNAFFALRL